MKFLPWEVTERWASPLIGFKTSFLVARVIHPAFVLQCCNLYNHNLLVYIRTVLVLFMFALSLRLVIYCSRHKISTAQHQISKNYK